MKPSLSQRLHSIMRHHIAAQHDKKIAFYLFLDELSIEERGKHELNPDTFARTWRRHRKSF